MAKLSAKNSSFFQKKKFKEISLSMRSCKKTDNTKFIKLDREMNELLSQSCDNEFVRRSIRIVGGLSRRFWFYRNKGILDDLPTIAKLHSKVCDAISVGNIKLALVVEDEHPFHIAFEIDGVEGNGKNWLYHRDGSISRYVDDPSGNKIELIWYMEKEK